LDFTKALQFNIDKLVGTLKDEEELKEVLKKKFTKKEYKVFVAIESGVQKEEIAQDVHGDLQRVEDLNKAACKKLNQEKIKQELVI
jgi:transcriptional regulator with PAS, ATPase and Fis domain